MRKRYSALLAAVLLCLLTGCTTKTTPLPESGSYPMEFLFSSGAGAWGTRLTLNADGTFEGQFSDLNMGETGRDYPNGTVYLCSFSGRFSPQESPDTHSCPLTLEELSLARPAGEEWIEDGVLHVCAAPYGLYNDYMDGGISRSFVLFAPDTPTLGLDESLLSWWPGRYEQNPPEALSCWALWNVDGGTAFFTDLQIAN